MSAVQRSYAYNTGAYVGIVVCSLFAGLVALATFCDAWLPFVRSLLKYHNNRHVKSIQDDDDDDDALILSGAADDARGSPGATTQSLVVKAGKESMGRRMLACFSLTRNIPKIFNYKTSPDALPVLDGMRVLSMWWVIYGHVYYWSMVYPTDDIYVVGDELPIPFFQADGGYVKNPWFQVRSHPKYHSLLNDYCTAGDLKRVLFCRLVLLHLRRPCRLRVCMYELHCRSDTFSHDAIRFPSVFKTMDKNGGKFPFKGYYVHRYLRLTPIYGFVFFFYSEVRRGHM